LAISATSETRRFSWQELFAVSILLALGLFTSFYLERLEGFHNDEYLTLWRSLAFYQGDWWLRSVDAQKPPLLYLLIAGIWKLGGVNYQSALIPSLWASSALPLLVYAIGRKLFVSRLCGFLAGAAAALSTLQILFAPTLFLDPLYITLALLAWHLQLSGHARSAGLVFAVAFATKQQALCLFPLLLIGSEVSISNKKLKDLMLYLLFGISCLLLWSMLGHGLTFPFVSQQIAGENKVSGGLFAAPTLWLERSLQWWQLLRLIFADGWICLLVLCSPLALNLNSAISTAHRRVSWLLLLWCLLLLACLLLVQFRLIERYLLPLVPVAAILIGALLAFAPGPRSLRLLLSLLFFTQLVLSLPSIPERAHIANLRTLSFYYLHFPALAGFLRSVDLLPNSQIYATPQLRPALIVLLFGSQIPQTNIRDSAWPLRLKPASAGGLTPKRYLFTHSEAAAQRFTKRLPEGFMLKNVGLAADGSGAYQIVEVAP
jgi:4-amino-4-deoxy-L-arabinose transferase-like glycosyltransferase